MNHRYKVATAALALLALPGVAGAATLTIDDFTSTQRVVDVPEAGSSDVNVSQATAPSAIGGFRDIQAGNDGAREDGTSASTNNSGLGYFRVSNESGASGNGTLTYDGNDDPSTVDVDGLGGVDFTFGGATTNNRFAFEIINVDFSFDYTISVFNDAGSASASGQTRGLTPSGTGFIPGPSLVEVSFSEFAGFDFADVGAVQLFFSGPDSSDLTIDLFRIEGDDISPVPLPAGLPLLVGGLFAFGALRRRARG